jgi:glycosyltransferase involved in cell wall biosynthesis
LVFLNTSVSPFAVIGARLAGVPVVVHTREIPTRRLVRWALSTFNARLATVVTANSRFTAAKVARRGPPPRVIYNGFEYPPDPPNPPASGCILAVARMSPDKGPDLVLKAFARILEALPEARLAVAGGPLPGHENFWRRIQELAAASGFRGRVTLHGWCENLAPLFRTNDVLLHLPHFEEPFGRAIVEAAGFGLPCVTFACGGIPEIVEDAVTGYLVAHRDVEAAAARCVHLLESPGLTARLGAAARKNAIERFPVERYIREMSDVFGALIHQMRQPSAARPPSPQE